MTTAGWPDCLELLAQHLAAQRAAIDRGELESVEAFVPDPDLGPLPPSLRERADELQAESDLLAALLTEAVLRTTEQMQALARPRRDAAPSYVDSRA